MPQRFDSLNRSERYFTATLLPLILMQDNWMGLERFIDLINKSSTTERDCNGLKASSEPFPTRPIHVEMLTEFHIARDLGKAGLIVPPPANESGSSTEKEIQDAPDLVIIMDHRAIVCEGKFFSKNNPNGMDKQLRSQRKQIKYLFNVLPNLVYRHIALLPTGLLKVDWQPDCDGFLIWDQIKDLSANVFRQDHYVTTRLADALTLHERENGIPGKKNYDGKVPLWNIPEIREQHGPEVRIGHIGGEAALLPLSIETIEGKTWKWRKPLNQGKALDKNWISI